MGPIWIKNNMQLEDLRWRVRQIAPTLLEPPEAPLLEEKEWIVAWSYYSPQGRLALFPKERFQEAVLPNHQIQNGHHDTFFIIGSTIQQMHLFVYFSWWHHFMPYYSTFMMHLHARGEYLQDILGWVFVWLTSGHLCSHTALARDLKQRT